MTAPKFGIGTTVVWFSNDGTTINNPGTRIVSSRLCEEGQPMTVLPTPSYPAAAGEYINSCEEWTYELECYPDGYVFERYLSAVQ